MSESSNDQDGSQELGRWLKNRRLGALLSLKDAANSLGLSAIALRQIEAGERSAQISILAGMTRLYQIPPDELVTRILEIQPLFSPPHS